MGERVVRRVALTPDHRSVLHARRLVQTTLRAAGLADLAVDAVLLTSELCENAVLHAGTDFELALSVDGSEVTIAVTDRGPGALEQRRAQPAEPGSRASTHRRGLVLVEQIATAWGTRHEAGRHQVWFTLTAPQEHAADPATDAPDPDAGSPGRRADEDAELRVGPVADLAAAALTTPDGPGADPAPISGAGPAAGWPEAAATRWLLRLPAERAARMGAAEIVGEVARRLCELVGADAAVVTLDTGDGRGRRVVAGVGDLDASADERASAVPLPLVAPLRGELRLALAPRPRAADIAADAADAAVTDLAELAAQRMAMAIEAEWVRGEVARRRSWTTYLAETSELLAQSLDLRYTTTIVPQLVVPRLGQWCAVHLADRRGRLALAAVSHADETAVPALRADLTGPRVAAAAPRGPAPAVTTIAGDAGVWPCVVAPLLAHGQRLGVLTVGRHAARAHDPDEVMIVADVARRAALAIDNASRNAEHVATSQALQEALLPRALPSGGGVEFAAAYRPASTGADVGGDFYDVHAIGEGRWIASIGDVCGKGARAAARTGQVRDVLRALTRSGADLPTALARLNDVLLDADAPDQFCTIASAELRAAGDARPGGGHGVDVDLVLAGHLRPYLARAAGGGRFVGLSGTAVGLIEDFQVRSESLRLEPGDAIVAYTDGVTERRRGREQFGDERLAAALAGAAGSPASRLVQLVLDAVDDFGDSAQRDDIAVLVVRAEPPQPVTGSDRPGRRR